MQIWLLIKGLFWLVLALFGLFWLVVCLSFYCALDNGLGHIVNWLGEHVEDFE